MSRILFKKESYEIIGICFDIHNYLGHGFSEVVYKEALQHELTEAGIFFEREKQYFVNYKGKILKHNFYADFVALDSIILEIKAISKITTEAVAQTINYLKVSENPLAMVINFGEEQLTYKRLINR